MAFPVLVVEIAAEGPDASPEEGAFARALREPMRAPVVAPPLAHLGLVVLQRARLKAVKKTKCVS